MMKHVVAILLVFMTTGQAWSQDVTSITCTGLKTSKESLILRYLDCKVGQAFDKVIYLEDIQRIKDLNLFLEVEGSYIETSDGINITIGVKEANYLYPILSASGFKNILQFQLGFNHINAFGNGSSLGAFYSYYGRHSINIYQQTPLHKNQRTGHEIAFSKLSTIEPVYFGTIKDDFNYDRYTAALGLYYWLTRDLRIRFSTAYLYEKFEKLENNFPDFPIGYTDQFHKLFAGGSLILNRTSTHYELIKGIAAKLDFESIETLDHPEFDFIKTAFDFRWYGFVSYARNNKTFASLPAEDINRNHSLAVRLKYGLATNSDSPLAPFVLDGYINVRGIGNRVARGTSELIGNIEYRARLLCHKWFIIQGVLFSDYGAIRPPGGSIQDMFSSGYEYVYSGLGVRIQSRVLYNTIFRLDYSRNTLDGSNGGFTFGFGQFF